MRGLLKGVGAGRALLIGSFGLFSVAVTLVSGTWQESKGVAQPADLTVALAAADRPPELVYNRAVPRSVGPASQPQKAAHSTDGDDSDFIARAQGRLQEKLQRMATDRQFLVDLAPLVSRRDPLWSPTERSRAKMRSLCMAAMRRQHCPAEIEALLASTPAEESWLVTMGYPSPVEYLRWSSLPLQQLAQLPSPSAALRAVLARRQILEGPQTLQAAAQKLELQQQAVDSLNALLAEGHPYALIEWLKLAEARAPAPLIASGPPVDESRRLLVMLGDQLANHYGLRAPGAGNPSPNGANGDAMLVWLRELMATGTYQRLMARAAIAGQRPRPSPANPRGG